MWINSKESNSSMSISEQREHLLKLNSDLIYWVYDLDKFDQEKTQLTLIDDVMTIYSNQLQNIKWLDECPNIILVDLWALRKWEFKVISWNDKPEYTMWRWFNSTWGYKTEVPLWHHTVKIRRKPVLLSNWVVEYVEWSTWKKHLITTLRDGWAFDNLQRTTTAWRNDWADLREDLEKEHFEEGPYLWKNKSWEYVLCIPDWNENGSKYTKESIEYWLKNKYNLSRENPENAQMIKIFERNFPWIKYEELWDILRDISKNDRFMHYSWDNKPIEELSDDMREISIWDKSMKAFVYYDEANNTFEYRDVRRITSFPSDFVPLSSRPWKLYLESQNQYSRIPRLENAQFNSPVPTIDYISKKVWDVLINKKD